MGMEGITIEQVMADINCLKYRKIFLCPKSLWWTHDEADLVKGKTPLGDKPIINHNPAKFMQQSKNKPEWYGRHGMKAFMKSHAKNCENCFYNKWNRYNDLIERHAN